MSEQVGEINIVGNSNDTNLILSSEQGSIIENSNNKNNNENNNGMCQKMIII